MNFFIQLIVFCMTIFVASDYAMEESELNSDGLESLQEVTKCGVDTLQEICFKKLKKLGEAVPKEIASLDRDCCEKYFLFLSEHANYEEFCRQSSYLPRGLYAVCALTYVVKNKELPENKRKIIQVLLQMLSEDETEMRYILESLDVCLKEKKLHFLKFSKNNLLLMNFFAFQLRASKLHNDAFFDFLCNNGARPDKAIKKLLMLKDHCGLFLTRESEKWHYDFVKSILEGDQSAISKRKRNQIIHHANSLCKQYKLKKLPSYYAALKGEQSVNDTIALACRAALQKCTVPKNGCFLKWLCDQVTNNKERSTSIDFLYHKFFMTKSLKGRNIMYAHMMTTQWNSPKDNERNMSFLPKIKEMYESAYRQVGDQSDTMSLIDDFDGIFPNSVDHKKYKIKWPLFQALSEENSCFYGILLLFLMPYMQEEFETKREMFARLLGIASDEVEATLRSTSRICTGMREIELADAHYAQHYWQHYKKEFEDKVPKLI